MKMIILFCIQVLECTGENTLSEDKNDDIVLYLGIRVYWREYTIRGQE